MRNHNVALILTIMLTFGYTRRKISMAILIVLGTGISCSSPSDKKNITPEDRASLLVEIARGALAENDPTRALSKLVEAERLNPEYVEIYHLKAIAYYAKKDTKEALSQIEETVQRAPDYSDALTTYGKILFDLGEYEKAKAPLMKASSDALYRDAFKPLTTLGMLYYRQGKYPEAEKSLSRAIELDPVRSCVAYYYLGHIRLLQLKNESALAFYKKATIKLCGNFPDAHLAIAKVYRMENKTELARKKLVEIIQLFPETPQADRAAQILKEIP